MALNCVDASNYTGKLTAEMLAEWKAIGVELVIIQAIAPPPGFPPEVDREQAQAIIDAGLKLGIYVFHWLGTRIAYDNAQRFSSYGFVVERWFGDFEDTTKGDANQREREIRDLLAFLNTLGGKRPAGGYSGKWWTDGYLPAGSQVFSGVAIWVAQYDNLDVLQAAELCGGTVVIHQYIGTSTLRGVPNVDLDVADPGEFTDPESPPVERETPTDYPFDDWRQSAIAYRGALDAMGPELATAQAQVAALSMQLAGTQKADTDAAAQLRALQVQVADLSTRIHNAGRDLGLLAA